MLELQYLRRQVPAAPPHILGRRNEMRHFGLDAADFAESGAEESYSEGVIDHLRAVQGTAVAALVRDRIGDTDGNGKPLRKVSLRASDERVDVSAIARAQGGGGHRQAAGFTTDMELSELIERLRAEVGAQL